MIRSILWLFVAINIGLGVGCLVDPIALLGPVGIRAEGAHGLIELRAMYGGLELGFGLFLMWCAKDPSRFRTGLMAAMCQVGGLGLARSATTLWMAPEGWLMPVLCAAEIGGAITCAVLLRRMSSGTSG